MPRNDVDNKLPDLPELPEIDGEQDAEPPPARTFAPMRRPTARRELRVKLARAEWNMMASLRRHYDMPASQLMRLAIRELYTDLHTRAPKAGGEVK